MPEITPAETLRKAAALMRKRSREATPGPWWHDEDDNVWRLHGVAFTTPPFLAEDGTEILPGQRVNSQILKAPKHGTPYAEYWPGEADTAHITSWHPLAALAVADLLDRIAWLVEADGAEAVAVIGEAATFARLFLGEGSDA
jgi:hypothetical protein